jgi:hypothetical protein
VQQAESSASRIHQQGSARDDGGAQGQEASIHAGGAAGQPQPTRTECRSGERILDTCGRRPQHHQRLLKGRRGSSGGGGLPTSVGRSLRQPRRSLTDAGTPGNPCVQPGDPRGNFPQRFRQATSIDKYTGETDPRVWLNDYRLACQMGGATTDEMIIRNLPPHLADSARTWLELLLPS